MKYTLYVFNKAMVCSKIWNHIFLILISATITTLLMYLIISKVDPGFLAFVLLAFIMTLYCVRRMCFTNTRREEAPRHYTEPVRIYNPSSVVLIVNPESHYNLGYRMKPKYSRSVL